MTTEQAKALVRKHYPSAVAEKDSMGMIGIYVLKDGKNMNIAGGLSERGAWNAAAQAVIPDQLVKLEEKR